MPDLLKLGLISKLDQHALAQYCEAVSDYRRITLQIQEINNSTASGVRGDLQTSRNGHQGPSGLRQMRTDAERRVNDAGRQFGFSPMARRTLKAPAPQGELFPNEQKQIADKYFS